MVIGPVFPPDPVIPIITNGGCDGITNADELGG